jgi:hypothetical protein
MDDGRRTTDDAGVQNAAQYRRWSIVDRREYRYLYLKIDRAIDCLV